MSLLQMSLAGAVMILVITIVRAIAINLVPKKTFMVLWGIAAARLLLPFSLPSMFSVYSLVGNRTSGTAAAKVPQISEVLPTEATGQMTAMSGGVGDTASTISVWEVIWFAGALVCTMVFAIAYWKCRREFQASLPVENDFIKNWLNTHRQKRPISIRQSDRFSTPLTYGVFHPVILMPMSADWKNTKALQYVLAHEYVHIRRFDSITKLVLTATLCVHWFNPLVWVMYILANRDMELSCDETVVRFFGENTKASYARTLINMEETRSEPTPLCNNFSKNAIEERITAIMKIKKASFFSLVLALALIVSVTAAFATSAARVPEQQNGAASEQLEFTNFKALENSINLADSDNMGHVRIVGDQTFDEPNVVNINDLNSADATAILENAESMEITLISVSHDDERKFTPKEWSHILDLIDEGKVSWED